MTLMTLSMAAQACALILGLGSAQPKPLYAVVSDVRALQKAAQSVGQAGATIVLRPGTYRLTQPLTFRRSHVNIVGSGWNTAIQRVGDGDAIVFEDASFCTVRDLLINGDASAKTGNGIVYRGRSSSCTVDFCRISLFAESGILYDGDAKRPQSSNTVSRCHFISNGGDQLRSVSNNDFYIVQNQFGAHTGLRPGWPRSGASLWPSSAGTYSMNYHWGNRVALRVGPGSHFNRFENNRFEESREHGALIGQSGGSGCYLNVFTGNTFHTNSQEESGVWPAVEAFGASDVTFTSNQIFSWSSDTLQHRHGLVIGAGCRRWIVKDNIIRHNTHKAIMYDETSGHIVKDNLGE